MIPSVVGTRSATSFALSGGRSQDLYPAEAHGAGGDQATMQGIMKELVHNPAHRYFSPYDMAKAHGLLRDEEQAFFWLEKAFDEHNPDLIELPTEPSFDGLRSSPRFVQLLLRIGFDVAEGRISSS
jgi:hypothetical protein